jgi:hypothetical protein
MRLISQNTAETLNPRGAQMEPGIILKGHARVFISIAARLNQSRGFFKSAHQVEALNRLAAGAFDQVVLRTHHDQPARTRIMAPGDLDEV